MVRLERLINRYFKFYLTLTLIGFIIAILLMNVPRILADEGLSYPVAQPAAVAPQDLEPSLQGVKDKINIRLSSPTAVDLPGSGGFLQYRGNKLSFVLRF